MTKIRLAKTAAAGSVVDLETLVVSRMLIQGGSGSGKSTLARRLLEQTAGRIQQIILDPEGEFRTLKKVGDYLLCADDGDIPIDIKSAALLAKRIRQTGVSAIIDIYELNAMHRSVFAKAFLEGLVAAPKKYWRECILFVDEAHKFAPKSQSSICTEALRDVADRGRKRKLGLVCATHRQAKLHNDVIAELHNRMIGQTGLKGDLISLAAEMGLTYKETREALVGLKPGQFWSFGPAVSPEYTLFQAAQTKTREATAETQTARASASLSKVIASLEDLPQQAAKEAKTLADLKADNVTLKRENRRLERATKVAGIPEKDVQKRIANALSAVEPVLVDDSARLGRIMSLGQQIVDESAAAPAKAARKKTAPKSYSHHLIQQTGLKTPAAKLNGEVSPPQQRILDAIAKLENVKLLNPPKVVIAAVAGVSPKSSGYTNNLGALRTLGLIRYGQGKTANLTEAGKNIAAWPDEDMTLHDYHESWRRLIGRPRTRIMDACIEHYPDALTKDEAADLAGVSPLSSGYTNNLGNLRTLGLIEYPAAGMVKGTALLIPPDLA